MATPDIIVQVKGGKSTAIVSPTGGATKLVQLVDVRANTAVDGAVLGYVQANNDFEFLAGVPSADLYARARANGAFDEANAAYANANTAIYTAAQIRANISNTAPVNYDPSTGIISHADSGALVGTYGNTTFTPTITVDAKGHITSIVNTAIALPPSSDQFARDQANAAFDQANTANVTGQAAFDKANTDFTLATTANTVAAAAYAQANIATTNADAAFTHSNAAFTLATTANTVAASAHNQANIATTNADAAFTKANASFTLATTANTVAAAAYAQANIATTNADAAFVHANGAFDKANGAVQTGFVTINVAGQANVVADSNTDVLTLVAGQSMVITTDAANDTITFSSTATGSGGNSFTTFNVAGQSDVVADSNNDTLTLIAGTGIILTTDAPNDTITIVATGGSALDQFARDQANAAYNQANIATTNADAAFTHSNAAFVLATTANTVAASAYNQANIATANADAAFARANAAYSNANTAIYTAAQIRANISNTFPVGYSSATGVISLPSTANGQLHIGNTVSGTFDLNTIAQTAPVIVVNDKGSITLSHASSGVTAKTYGNATLIPVITVDAFGHITAVSNAAITASGLPASTANGQLLIGNTVSSGFDENTLTQGTNITVTNGKGTITISSSDAFAQAQANAAFNQANAAYANANTAIYTAAQIRANISNTAPIRYDATTGIVSFVAASANGQTIIGNTVSGSFDVNTIAQTAPVIVVNGKGTITLSHASSGVTATGYGTGALIPVFVVDAFGHITSVTNTAIAGLSTGVLTSGILPVSRGGTGKDATGLANGQILVGNTVNTGFDLVTIAQSAPIIITNGQGTITVSHARSGVAATGYGDAADVPVFVVDANGHITSVTNTAIAIPASQITSGILSVARGGTGKDATGLVNGSILIGNTVNTGFDLATLTQGTNITITNAKGAITIASSDAFAQAQANAAFNQANLAYANANTAIYTATQIRANISNTTPILYSPTTGVVSLIPSTANGQFLIGNTVSSGYDLNTLSQGTNITVTNAKGSVTIASSDAFAQAQANAAFNQANLAYANANTAIYTATQIRANISNTAPINYAPATGIISHNASGVATGVYGNATIVPSVTIDTFGHITNAVNTAIQLGSTSQVGLILLEDSILSVSTTNAATSNAVNSVSLIAQGAFNLANNIQATAVTGGGVAVLYCDPRPNTIGADVLNFTLSLTPSPNTELNTGTTVNANTRFLARFISANSFGVTSTIDAGTWDFTTYANTSSTGGSGKTSIVQRINKRYLGAGTLTATGSGTTRTLTITGATPFFAGMANTDIIGAYVIETPLENFFITAFTSSSIVTGTLDNSSEVYVNETGVAYYIYQSLFDPIESADLSTTPLVYTSSIFTQAISANVGDTLVAAYFARTTKNSRLVYVFYGGTQRVTHLHTPIVVRHNRILGLQGGTLTSDGVGEYYHLTNTEYSKLAPAYNQANTATTNADAAFARANAAYANANTAIYTATQIRANISASLPISYSSATGVISLPSTANGQTLIGNTVSGAFDVATIAQSAPIIITNGQGTITVSHARSGVTATGYGTGALIPAFVVDANGHITAVTNTAIAGLDVGVLTTGILSVARGGTGKDATGLVNGALHIGNTVNTGFDLTTIAQTAPVIVVNGKGTITLSHASSGATPTTYGNATQIPMITVDAFGHITAVSNTTSASAGLPAATVNGQILIGNTVSGGFDENLIAQTAPVIVVNGKGTVTLSHASSGVTAAVYGNDTIIPVVTVDAFGHITSVVNTAITFPASSSDTYARNAANNGITAFILTNEAGKPGTYSTWASLYTAYTSANSPLAIIGFLPKNGTSGVPNITAGSYSFRPGTEFRGFGDNDPSGNQQVAINIADLTTIFGVSKWTDLQLTPATSFTTPVVYMDSAATTANGIPINAFTQTLTRTTINNTGGATAGFFRCNTSGEILILDTGCVINNNTVDLGTQTAFTIVVKGVGSIIATPNVVIGTGASPIVTINADIEEKNDIRPGVPVPGTFTGRYLYQASAFKAGPTSTRPGATAAGLLANGQYYYDQTLDQPLYANNGIWRVRSKQVLINFGAGTASDTSSNTITDTSVTVNSIIIAEVAYKATPGTFNAAKDQDEFEMDQFHIVCSPAAGSFTMFLMNQSGYAIGEMYVNYHIY